MATNSTVLAEFLLARIAEEELDTLMQLEGDQQAPTVLRRRLAECAERRRVVRQCTYLDGRLGGVDDTPSVRVLRELVLAYADREGFDPDWLIT